MDMNSINQVANTTTQYETAKTSKSKISGRTIGDVKLSDEAAKYYEQLKEKYSNMEFVLVSKDMKEQAQAQAASFANPSKMVVLIDEEKVDSVPLETVIETYTGILTGYGPDCVGCGNPNTGKVVLKNEKESVDI